MAMQGVPTSRYRFLLTVARRAGINDIRIQAVLSDNSESTQGSTKKIDIKLPCEIDGCDVEDQIKAALTANGFRNACISEYLGSRIIVKDGHPMCFFRFKVCNRSARSAGKQK